MNGLTLRGVRVEYGGCAVVSSVDETLSAGEWLCLIGPNGAGKSSLLRALAGLVDFSGSVQLGGSEICGLSARELARQVAFVPQDPVLPDDMSVTDYVMLGRNPYISTFGRESAHDRDVVAGLITELSLAVYARRMLGTLSGGERQRVVIARALAQEAPVLLLDEPCSALDPIATGKVEDLIQELRGTYSVLMVTHNMQQASRTSDYTAFMYLGRLIEYGPTTEIFTKPILRETEAYVTGRFG